MPDNKLSLLSRIWTYRLAGASVTSLGWPYSWTSCCWNIGMRPTKPKVALIVRTFNAQPHLERLLAAIGRQSVVPNRLLAIDLGSTDGTAARLEDFGAEVYAIPPCGFDDNLRGLLG